MIRKYPWQGVAASYSISLEGRWRIWRILNWFQFSWKWWIFCCFWVRLFLRCSPFFKVRKTEQIKMPTLSANRVGDVLRDIWTSLKASTFWSGCFLYVYYTLVFKSKQLDFALKDKTISILLSFKNKRIYFFIFFTSKYFSPKN